MAAALWSELAVAFFGAGEAEEPGAGEWARISEAAAAVLSIEEDLWNALAG